MVRLIISLSSSSSHSSPSSSSSLSFSSLSSSPPTSLTSPHFLLYSFSSPSCSSSTPPSLIYHSLLPIPLLPLPTYSPLILSSRRSLFLPPLLLSSLPCSFSSLSHFSSPLLLPSSPPPPPPYHSPLLLPPTSHHHRNDLCCNVLPYYHNISAITLSQMPLTLYIFSWRNDVVSSQHVRLRPVQRQMIRSLVTN